MRMRAKAETHGTITDIQQVIEASASGVNLQDILDSMPEVPLLRRYHQLEVLNRVSSTVNALQDLDAILSIALDSALEIVKGTSGGILLMDKESGMLGFRAHRGLAAQHVDEIRVPLGEGISGRVARSGKPVVTNDVTRDARVFKPELGGVESIRAFVSVPLKRRDELVGALTVGSHETGRFTDDDVSILSAIGEYLAIAVVRSTVDRKITKGMERYQALLRYALKAQEDERKRLARELHDETSQTLTSLTFRLQAAIQMADIKGFGDSRFKEGLRKAHDSAVQAGNEILKLMMDLRPTLLDDLGMPAAIHRYAKDTLETKGINVGMECIGQEYRLPAEVEVAFFRVAQGLISNILKHSEAKNVSIRVECDPAKAVLCIEDDGSGFDVNKITEIEPSGRGAGLFTMRERLRVVGGTDHVESRLGQGTRITVTVPIIKDLKDLADAQDNRNDR